MKYLARILFLVGILAPSAALGQEVNQREKSRFVAVPRAIALPLIAVQPDCPLQFESVERLARVGGGGANNYKLRNRSAKPIRSFTVSYTFMEGTGGSWSWTGRSGELVAPGQLVPVLEDPDDEIIPLTQGLRDELKLRGPMKGIIVYMVERVEFADGSIYCDEAASKALKAYLEEIGEKVYEVVNRPKKN